MGHFVKDPLLIKYLSLVSLEPVYSTGMRTLAIQKKIVFFYLSAAIVSGILPFIAIFNKYLFFQINDDLLIMGRASGIFYGTPTDELIFISPPLSSLMKYLYVLTDSQAWYTIILLSTQYLAVFAYFIIFEKKINSLTKINGLLIYMIAGLPIFIFFILFHSLQFTQTGIMAAGLGALAFLLGDKKFKKILGLFLVSLGILWRIDGSLVAILFVLILFLFVNFLETKKLFVLNFIKTIVPVVLVATVSYGTYALSFNTWAPWISAEKKEYVELKNVFTQLYGFESTATSYSSLETPAKEAGFSTNDWELFQKYYFLNDEVFSVNVLAQIAEKRIQDPYLVFAQKTLNNLIKIGTNSYKEVLIASFCFSILAVFFARKHRFLLLLGFWALLLVFFFAILLFGERLPDRVSWPFTFVALSTLSALTIIRFSSFEKLGSYNSVSKILFACVGAIFLFSFNEHFKEHQQKIDDEIWWKVAPSQGILGIEKIYYFKPEKPIVAFSSFYSPLLKTLDPLDAPSDLPPIWNKLILVGWENKTPEFNQRLAEYGLTPDLFTSIAVGDAYLATYQDPNIGFEVHHGSIYLREHKNIEVIWERQPMVYSDAGLAIWRANDFKVIK